MSATRGRAKPSTLEDADRRPVERPARAEPPTDKPDYKALRERLSAEFAKTLAYLAK